MNPEDELLDLIDNYLNKGMPEEERLAFEEKMASDKTLAAMVQEAKRVNEAIYYASLAEMKMKIGQDIKNIKYKPPFNWKKASYISIVSLVLVGVTTYIITNNTKVASNKTEPINSTKETEQKYFHNNSPSLQEKNAPKPPQEQEHLPSKKGSNDTLPLDNNSIRKPILPDNNLLNTVEEKQTIAAAKKDSASIIERKAAPALNETKVLCNKSFTITTEASCKQKETGSIVVLSDGAYQYTFNVEQYSTSGSKGFFQNIGAGDYDVVITYGKECTFTKKATVTEKWCAMNSSFSFNPDYNEKWALKYEQGTSGTFTIFDKAGKEIYGSSFGAGNEEWNGTDKNGGIIPMGIYIAIIDYSDGRKEKVELTIVR